MELLKIQELQIYHYVVKLNTQNPHGEDHSIFIGFAPKNNPKIAIAVYIENGGYGSKWAAPLFH